MKFAMMTTCPQLLLCCMLLGCGLACTASNGHNASDSSTPGDDASDSRNIIEVVVLGSEQAFAEYTVTVAGEPLPEAAHSIPRSQDFGRELWRSSLTFCAPRRSDFLTLELPFVATSRSGVDVETWVERPGCRYSDLGDIGNYETDGVVLEDDGTINARFEDGPIATSSCGETDPAQCYAGELVLRAPD